MFKNATCHDTSLSNEHAVIYPPIVAMKPCVIICEMDKGFDDACNMKLRHISFLNVLSKSNNMNKMASTCEILSHNRSKRPWTECDVVLWKPN